MKTQAAILIKQNQPLVLDEIELPELKNGQLIVRVVASGICRSQINEWQGLKGPDPYLPHLLGHEGAGVVAAVSRGVKKVKPGDHVVLTWIKAEGLDAGGAQYRWGSQTVNSGAVATLVEYAIVSENRVVKISKKISAPFAALLGCAVPTGGGMVLHSLKMNQAKSLVVFGVGGIGASAIMTAAMKKVPVIIGVDVSDKKLKFAKKIGATHIINARTADVFSALRKLIPNGPDYAIESSGNKMAMEQAFAAIADRGTLVIAGNLPRGEKIAIDPFDLIKGKTILGTWGGETIPERDIPHYARAYRMGQMPLENLITRRFSFKDINKALLTLSSGDCNGRIVIDF